MGPSALGTTLNKKNRKLSRNQLVKAPPPDFPELFLWVLGCVAFVFLDLLCVLLFVFLVELVCLVRVFFFLSFGGFG